MVMYMVKEKPGERLLTCDRQIPQIKAEQARMRAIYYPLMLQEDDQGFAQINCVRDGVPCGSDTTRRKRVKAGLCS